MMRAESGLTHGAWASVWRSALAAVLCLAGCHPSDRGESRPGPEGRAEECLGFGPLARSGVIPEDAVVYRVKDILPGYASSEPRDFADLGGVALFAANDGASGTELWRSDGTASGTWLVRDIVPGAAGSEPGEVEGLRVVDRRVIFTANDPSTGTELWASDGTTEGTYLVKDIRPGAEWWEGPRSLTVAGRRIFFRANDGTTGDELWVSDGTEAGTRRVADLNPGPSGSYPSFLTAVGDRLFWVAVGGVPARRGLWVLEGASAAPRLVRGFDCPPERMAAVGSLLYFFTYTCEDCEHEHYVLWTSDGTEAGTSPVVEPFAGSPSTKPTELTAMGDELYFVPLGGRGLWKSDGTPAGTGEVFDGCDGGDESWLVNVDDTLFCRGPAADGASWAIWGSCGSSAGSSLVKDGFALEGGKPGRPIGLGGLMLFRAGQEGAGSEPWVSDGTAAGTELAYDVLAGEDTSHPRGLAVVGDRVFFSADDGTAGIELWAFGEPSGPESVPPRRTPSPGNHPPQIIGLRAYTIGGTRPNTFEPATVECQVVDVDGDAVTVTATIRDAGWGWIDHQSETSMPGEALPPEWALLSTTLYTVRPASARLTCRAFDSQGAEAEPASARVRID